MKKLMIATVLLAAGCGTIFNKRTIEIGMDPGVTVNGQSGTVEIDQREEHEVRYADGRTCKIRSGVGAAYVIVNLFTTGPIGMIVDAVTGGWRISKSDCAGIYEK